jgi:hypothetical protein
MWTISFFGVGRNGMQSIPQIHWSQLIPDIIIAQSGVAANARV